MLNPTALRAALKPRFDPRRVRIDPAHQADLARTRGLRAAALLGRRTPYDLKTPWLTLRPDHPIDPAKGWLEYTSPSSVGMGQFDDGQYLFAAFDLIFQKQTPDSYSAERPRVAIQLVSPPTPTMIVEMDLFAHDAPEGDPKFELWAATQQFLTIADAKRDTIMFLMNDSATLQSAWADGQDFTNRDGNWAFFEARISAVS